MTQRPWQTIPEMVLSAADRFGDAEAVVDGPLRLTFTEMVERIRCAAGAFADLDVDKGDRVAIWAPNSAEWIIAAFGLLTAGGVLVPVPVSLAVPWFTDDGSTSLEWLAWPAGVPASQTIYVQFAIQDQSAYQGVALSTALRAVTP